MIISSVEMPEAQNHGHMTTSIGDVMDRNNDVKTFISKYIYFKKS